MYYHEFQPGLTLVAERRTIVPEDIDAFIDLSGLDNPIFRSDDGARAAGHKQRIIPAPLQLSIAMGMAQQAGWFDHVAAVAEFREMKFLRPALPNDSFELRVTVAAARPTSNPARGWVELDYQFLNGAGQATFTARGFYLFMTK